MTHRTQQSGFTLLETLVAVVIFSLALVALMTISSQGIRATDQATKRATAQFLAQEGIELVEMARDDNFLDISADWLDGVATAYGGPCGPAPDRPCRHSPEEAFTGQPFVACSGQCRVLGQNTNGLYGYTNNRSPFRRTIYIDDTVAVSDGHVKVTSIVEWNRGSVTYSVEAIKYMTNWFQ
jgi:prepilin-type N-terminal cleavage/methylation domain-containing protein